VEISSQSASSYDSDKKKEDKKEDLLTQDYNDQRVAELYK